MKPKIFMQLSFLLLILAIPMSGYAQNKPMVQDKPSSQMPVKKKLTDRNFYRKSLQVDSVTADKIAKIQNNYKAGMKAVMGDTSLNDAAKRARIKALIDAKNRIYKGLLTPAQQAKLIPSTEREAPKKKLQ